MYKQLYEKKYKECLLITVDGKDVFNRWNFKLIYSNNPTIS